MKRWIFWSALLALSSFLCKPVVSETGANSGGTLIVHASPTLLWTADDDPYCSALDIGGNGECEVATTNQPTSTGACCFPDGSCAVAAEEDCLGQAGVWVGPDYDCDPNPCPTAVLETTWGRIKSAYR